MTFRGLFIGIDRHASHEINWLSCAKRDATALHALFHDNLGGECKLLVDEQATRAAIESSLSELEGAGTDDVVVIFFSGHGTKTHELVCFDTDRRDLSSTAISLDRLTDCFRKIPSRRLICILDC